MSSRLIDGILGIKPLANFAKSRARKMMVERAEKIGVPWRKTVDELRSLDWERRRDRLQDPTLTYPDYYLTSFHAYEEGNMSWDAAFEQECAACAVHAKVWPEAGKDGDRRLRQSYQDVLRQQLPREPQRILDLGCGVGMSTFALQELYPEAKVTGVDLSPYFLSVAEYNSEKSDRSVTWKHAPAEATGFRDRSFDLVSACSLFHEVPLIPTRAIFAEALRLLSPGGYFALMDTNPRSQAFAKMPGYVFTLFKSTEPYLDDYFSLDLEDALQTAGFEKPSLTCNSPRHRAIIAKKPD
ncbi:MAG: class I SAM-dependent methyltransferase [Cyanobacteria bacterium SBLK]|nr:class I SAM-dependent methyltransferase [Cyanobacteria bacterium SBLK]